MPYSRAPLCFCLYSSGHIKADSIRSVSACLAFFGKWFGIFGSLRLGDPEHNKNTVTQSRMQAIKRSSSTVYNYHKQCVNCQTKEAVSLYGKSVTSLF